MWVFDATPLIYLAKVEHLGLLGYLDGPREIPERVYAEVVETGLEEGYPDARRVERQVEHGTFEVVSAMETPLFDRLLGNDDLSDADAAVLARAEQQDGTAVLDETYGRDVAATEGVETRGTAFLALVQVRDGYLDVDEGRDVIDAMLDSGWYCAPDVYAKILRKFDALSIS